MPRLLRSQPAKPYESRPAFQQASYPPAVFTSACNSSADFTSVNGSGITVGNAGTGYLGKSIRIVMAASVEQSARKVYKGLASVHQMWLHTGSADTISATTDTVFFSGFSDAAFGTPVIQIRLIGSGAGYTLRMVDPTNGYATTVGSTVLTKGTWHRIVLSITASGYQLYIDNQTSPEASYTHANATVGLYAGAYGNWYSGTSSYTGTIDLDELYASNLTPGLSSLAQQAADATAGFFQKYLAYDGAIVRSPSDGTTLTVAGPDIVSEGQAYGLKLAVQSNDQTTFNLLDNWARANLDRKNSTVGNTQANPAPANALNLMAFHYNTSNADGKGPNTIYDANWAGDADHERAQALLWAHARWGSSALTLDTGPELLAPNYLQRALNILSDIRTYALRLSSSTGYYYLVADQAQTGDAVAIAADYNNTAAFKLFAQYDSGNAAIWNGAISGAHDIATKSSNQIMSGETPSQTITKKLIPNWITFTLSTGLTSSTPSGYGNSDYGYNAFRAYYRGYDMWNWYADANALTVLQLPKAFFVAEWALVRTGSPLIEATYKHDGTITGSYEKTFFYWAAYWTIYAGDTSNTTASAIKSGKLDSKYVQSPVGSYIDNGGYAYFDQPWSIVGSMQKAGTFINYGQSNVTTPSVTKGLKYTVYKNNSVTKTLKYTVYKASSPLTKSLKYTVYKPSSLTKTLKYTVYRNSSVSKSLKYTIGKSSVALTKSLKYAAASARSTTRSLKYTVQKNAATLTKSLKYCVALARNTTKTIKYTVRTNKSVTKSLTYNITGGAVTHSVTKSLKYAVRATQAAVTKGLKYTVYRTPVALTKSLKYTVSPVRAVSKSLKYTVYRPTALTKSLKYTVYKTAATLTKSLRYTIFKVPVVAKTLKYMVIRPVSTTKPLKYTVFSAKSTNKPLSYRVVTARSTSKALAYRIGRTITVTKTVKYTVKATRSLTKSLRYVTTGSVGLYKTNNQLALLVKPLIIPLGQPTYPVWNTAGRPLITGAYGFNSQLGYMEIYTGSVWKPLYSIS